MFGTSVEKEHRFILGWEKMPCQRLRGHFLLFPPVFIHFQSLVQYVKWICGRTCGWYWVWISIWFPVWFFK